MRYRIVRVYVATITEVRSVVGILHLGKTGAAVVLGTSTTLLITKILTRTRCEQAFQIAEFSANLSVDRLLTNVLRILH